MCVQGNMPQWGNSQNLIQGTTPIIATNGTNQGFSHGYNAPPTLY